MMFAFFVIALLLTLGVAIVGWFRPVQPKPPSPPTYTAQQTADAKAKVCAAHDKVHHAVGLTSARSSDDPTLHLALATSGRQALDVGGDYLLTTLAQQPATPPDLAAAIHKLANTFQELTVDYLAEVSDAELDPLLRTSDQLTLTIQGLCK
ncbi:hypothetical protein OK015_17160 [Mycobacterium sp. Aquia_216]|uniref:hypothetical protein n=1 Tax=Mycobacterium sp. Aquia_216 TaxID=2991729 RepID=UPI00227B6ED9|nr:hypothetical protein [Mycobacterium sp. Aquia_216]WAJ42976.1 hypothetical protein OK015_17160 [Mycobacterium sp. Aquia_216]